MTARRRLLLFLRGLVRGAFLPAWERARMRDCERSGGHRLDPAVMVEPYGPVRYCARCGCGMTQQPPAPFTMATTARFVAAQNGSSGAHLRPAP